MELEHVKSLFFSTLHQSKEMQAHAGRPLSLQPSVLLALLFRSLCGQYAQGRLIMCLLFNGAALLKSWQAQKVGALQSL